MGKAVRLNVDAVAHQLRAFSFEERDLFMQILSALVRKPRVTRCPEGFLCHMGPVHGEIFSRWTMAVRFAHQWHSNMFASLRSRV